MSEPVEPVEPVQAAPVVVDDAMLAVPPLGLEVDDIDSCAVDIDVPMVRLAAPLVSLVVVAGPADERSDHGPIDCTAPIIAELPAELLAVEVPPTERSAAHIRVRVGAPQLTCETTHAIGACLRDRSGALHAARIHDGPAQARSVTPHEGGTWLNAPRLLTPSGPVDDTLGVARGWQLVGADPATGARVRVEVRGVRHGLGAAVLLQLATGERLRMPGSREVWHTGRSSWTRASQVVAGDPLFGLAGPVTVRSVEPVKVDRSWVDVADVSAPDTYFHGGVLVRDGRPTPGAPVPLTPAQDPDQRAIIDLAAEAHSYDCALRTTLTLRGWPEHTEEITLLAARHPGPPGARVAPRCDTGDEIARVPRALWDVWRAHRPTPDATLTLSFDAGADGWAAEDPEYTGAIGCSSDVALQTCARAADGALTPIMPAARWGLSGAPCFATGTPIETPAGPVAIEAIGPGALVRSVDVATGEPRTTRVLRRVSRGVRPVLEIRLADGHAFRVTGEHPLWLPGAGVFRPAGALHTGDLLLGADGAELRIADIRHAGTTEVWELSVAAPDTYFAGGILAHNY